MKRLMRLFAVLLKINMAVLIASSMVHAEGLSVKIASKNLKHIAKEYEATKKSILVKEEKQRQIMSALFVINKRMKKIVTEKAALDEQHLMIEASTQDLASRILELEQSIKSQKIQLQEKLSVIYRFGGQGIARALFSSKSSASLERNLKILGIIAERDLDLAKRYVQAKDELDTKKNKFVKKLAHLKELQARILGHEIKLVAENNLRKKLLEGIRKTQENSISKLNSLRNKTFEMGYADSGILDLLMRPSFFERKGALPAPVNGKIARNYGIIKDLEHNISWSQKGVLYSVDQNSSVRSVFDGKVTFVGEIQGYGQVIILDHGDHYYTTYGNNNSVTVKMGDEVKQGQIIARSGYSQAEKNNGLYFEIRHFSEPSDPKIWLRGTTL